MICFLLSPWGTTWLTLGLRICDLISFIGQKICLLTPLKTTPVELRWPKLCKVIRSSLFLLLFIRFSQFTSQFCNQWLTSAINAPTGFIYIEIFFCWESCHILFPFAMFLAFSFIKWRPVSFQPQTLSPMAVLAAEALVFAGMPGIVL